MYETIETSLDSRGVALLRLNRPERHNALSETMLDELTDAAARLGNDPAVRVVVLAGSGESFCAGGDLGWMRTQMEADAATRAAGARRLAGMLDALDTLPRPLIGRIHGPAYGGGVGLMAVCDVAIGVHGARFGLTETRLGLIPATIAPYVVARMGAAMARRVFLSGRLFDTDEAVRLGLVSLAVEGDALDREVEAEVAAHLAAAPGAVADAKRMLRRLARPADEAMRAETVAALVARWESREAAEGIAAFFERRRPDWRG